MRRLRLAHPDLAFWIDVRVRDFSGRWLAVADLADEPAMGMGETLDEALAGALVTFDARLREQLVASARHVPS